MSAAKPVAVADVVFSLKTFAAAMLAYWIALTFGLRSPFWAAGTVYIIAHPLSGATTSKAVYRLLGTALGATAIVVMVPLLVSSRELLTLGMAVWTAACLFISQLDRTPRSYVFMLAGYTAVLTGFTLVDAPQTSFDVSVARVEEIFIGIVCAALVSRAFWPRPAGTVLSLRVDGWLANAAGLAQDVLSGNGTSPHAVKARQTLAVDAVDLRSFATHVGYETREGRVLVGRMNELQARMVALLPLLSEVADLLQSLQREGSERGIEASWAEKVSSWIASEPDGHPDEAALLAELARAQRAEQTPLEWRELVTIRLAKRLHDLVEVWRDCRHLRADMAQGSVHRLSRIPTLTPRERTSVHTDYGMAALSALAVFIAILISCALWIGTGWKYGAGAVQMASILCCVLAFMDDAVPTLRKVLKFALVAVAVTFVYQFGILPLLDGFLPLVYALGLFLIPVGILLATPATWLLGFQLSVNLVYMLQLSDKMSMDFSAFVNASAATMVGIVIAIMTLSIVRTVGAEASTRRLLRAGWSMVIESTRSTSPRSGDVMLQRMVDQLGLLVPRMAALAPGSDLNGADILRDLRVGLNTLKIQRNKSGVPAAWQAGLNRLLLALADSYRARRGGRPVETQASIDAVDDCLALAMREATTAEQRRVRDALVGLRSALAPETTPSPSDSERLA
ncbi:MAG TPA: FUSC family protein [Rhodanobacter sp.]